MHTRGKRLSGEPVKKKPQLSGSSPRHACAAGTEAKQIYLPVTVKGIQTRAFVDSGATFNAMSPRMVQRLRITPQKAAEILPTFLFDGTRVADITHKTGEIQMEVDGHVYDIDFDIFPTMDRDMMLGTPWLRKFNPPMNWTRGALEKTHQYCQITTTQDSPPGVPSEYSEFNILFQEEEPEHALPRHQEWDHEIKLKEGCQPKGHKVYPISAERSEILREYIDRNVKRGFIRESTSPAGYPILWVPKKDGSLRLCVDYRPLNDMTVKNSYPLPLISELQDRLQGAQWFTKLDITEAYARIRVKEGEEWKTAFKTKFGLYEYQVMPFGLMNAPATWQAFINNVLREYLDVFVIVYLDDILIFSKTEEEHKEHVKKILRKLMDENLRIKIEKTEFHAKEVDFLGFVVGREGVKMDKKKVQAVLEWPTPKTVKDVQSFLGFANFYRRFIQGYSGIMEPVSSLTRKEADFTWGTKQEEAFQEMKRRFTEEPVLAFHDPEEEAVVETDASDKALGACLSQKKKDGKLHPIAYHSRKFSPAELNYDVHDKELLAIVDAFKQWKVYLEGTRKETQVYSDHKNLLTFTTTKVLNRRQVRWAEELASYRFKIHYRKGSENGKADALSRRSDYLVKEGKEPAAILRIDDQGTISCNANFIAEITSYAEGSVSETIRDFHDDTTAGHKGVTQTLNKMRRAGIQLPKMSEKVREYIAACDICSRTKHGRHKPYGLMKSPDVPDGPWESVAWDFITKLPESKEPMSNAQHDSILVITDRLTKFGYFLPYRESSTAEELAYTFLRRIVANHGLPREMISDRDKLFTSKFWQALTAKIGTRAKLSTAFHPQTDGQTERMNQNVEQYLRCYVNYEQDNWVEWLPMAQYAYNDSYHSVIKTTPFFANYGFHPSIRGDPRTVGIISQEANTRSEKMTELHRRLKWDIERLNEAAKRYYDKKRIEGPILKGGDKVYLLRRNIKTKRPSSKLDFTKLGPFEIEEKKGPLNYKLRLPEGTRLHPVFHIALLEPADPKTPLQTDITGIDPEFEIPSYNVEKILDMRIISNRPHYLVKWKGFAHTENTWEPIGNVKNAQRLVANFHRTNQDVPAPGNPQDQEKKKKPRGSPRKK